MKAQSVTKRVIQANGLRIHLASAGSGPGLLFITGTNADLRKPKSPLLSILSESFTVVTYDQRGMGQTEKPDGPYSLLDYAQDAVAVLDALGWNESSIAGYSFGGMVAQEVAVGWPDRVNRLALIATTAGGDAGSSYPIEKHLALDPNERARKSMEIADTRFTEQWQNKNPEATIKLIQERVLGQSEFENEPNAIKGRDLQLAARAEHNTADRLHHILCPTLVLAGTYDGQARIEAQTEMASRITNCVFETVEGSHGMLYENDDSFTQLARFFKA